MTKTLLIIGFVWPEPKSSAAGSRMMQLIALFQSQNYDIVFASPCAKSDNAFDLESIGVIQKTIELNAASFDDFIVTLNPKIVLFDRFMMEEQFGWRVAKQCPNAVRILDTEDLHFLRKARSQSVKDGELLNASYILNDTTKREIASIYRSDLSLIISEAEMEILKIQFKIEDHILYYLPFLMDTIAIETQNKLPIFKEREHFITVGNFLHEPNFDAITFLKSKIWPRIHKKLPKAEMHIYGAYESEKVKQLHSEKERFLIKGFVEDIHEKMQKSRVCLAPLRFGAGLKGKLLDAMANGLPCVTTSIGAEGMFGNLKPNGFIADDPSDFADKAIELYTNKIFWKGHQKNGFAVLHTRFDTLIFKSDFLQHVEMIYLNLDAQRQQNFIGQMLMHHTMQSTKYMSRWIEAKNKA